MSFLLEIQLDKKLGFLDALTYGGQTVLLGMATVFAVLTIIWLALVLFKIFLYDIPNKKAAEAATATEPAAVVPISAGSDEDEIIAVIAAAIAAAESEAGGVKFKVVSFRRK